MEDEGLEKNGSEEERSEESEIFKKEINEFYESNELRTLMLNNELLKTTMIDINDEAVKKYKLNKNTEALAFLKRAEKTLEFAASCGKNIDRNIIIIVLYNIACVYQTLWKLEKCAKYLDAVIYNLTESLQDAKITNVNMNSSITDEIVKEVEAMKLKKMKFLIQSYLQYCAILSQINKHDEAKKNAFDSLNTINNLFKIAYRYANDLKNKSLTAENKKAYSKNQINSILHSKNKSLVAKTSNNEFLTYSQEGLLVAQQKMKEETTTEKNKSFTKMDIPFKKILLDFAYPILSDLSKTPDNCSFNDNTKQQMLLEVKKSLYFWKRNPENNERDLRKELNAPKDNNPSNKRSLLGLKADNTEWIENFNIGSIMHMNPVKYEEFCFFGDLNYEISKNQLLEKVIFQSICFFTIATEMRFIEIEKNGGKVTNTKDITSEQYKLSELYHLKAIEIVCKYIKEDCPYINHLITSYHKHYNSDLDVIQEESLSHTVKKTDDEENAFITESPAKEKPEQRTHISNNSGKFTKENIIHTLSNKMIVSNDKKVRAMVKKPLNFEYCKKFINEKKNPIFEDKIQMNKIRSILQSLQIKEKLKFSKQENPPFTKMQAKNKSLSARTHNENKMNNVNSIEQLKRLNVYDELIALKKIAPPKNTIQIIEKTIYNDTQQKVIENVCEPKKSFPQKNSQRNSLNNNNSNSKFNEKIPKLNFESLFHNKNEEKPFFSPKEKISKY